MYILNINLSDLNSIRQSRKIIFCGQDDIIKDNCENCIFGENLSDKKFSRKIIHHIFYEL